MYGKGGRRSVVRPRLLAHGNAGASLSRATSLLTKVLLHYLARDPAGVMFILPHVQNTSGTERRTVIMGWVASATRWQKGSVGAMFSTQHEERLEAAGRMTPLLKSLTAPTFEG